MPTPPSPTPQLPLKKGISLRWLPIGFILLQSLLYGFGDPISKSAYEVLPVYSLLTARYGIALVFLLLLFGRRIFQGLRACSPKDWLLPSLCMGGAYVANNIALELTAATSVAFLRSLSTVMTPLLALAVYRRRMGKQHIPVQLVVILGLYLLCGQGGLSGFGWGELFSLLSALLLAGSLIFGEKALNRVDPLTLTALQTAASLGMAALCALFLDGGVHLAAATPTIWATIFYLALGCTVAGYLLQNAALGGPVLPDGGPPPMHLPGDDRSLLLLPLRGAAVYRRSGGGGDHPGLRGGGDQNEGTGITALGPPAFLSFRRSVTFPEKPCPYVPPPWGGGKGQALPVLTPLPQTHSSGSRCRCCGR